MQVRWAWLTLLSTWKLPDATCSSFTNEYFILTLSPSRVVNDNRALLLSLMLIRQENLWFFSFFTTPFNTFKLYYRVFCIYREWTNHDKFLPSTSWNNVCVTERTSVPFPVAQWSSALLCPLCSGTITRGLGPPEYLPSKHSIFWSNVDLTRSYPSKYNNWTVFYTEMPWTPVMYPTMHLNS